MPSSATTPSLVKSDHTYRPEIDGLRALAVLFVVLYHAGLGVPGGYIGVDVFFVISGFLIGGIIWREVRAGTFSLLQFWERRARRIVPALVVMCLCVLAAGWILLMPLDYENLGKSAAAQALFAANFYFRQRTGYFHPTIEQEPLLHTWSLALEEQYYLVAPLALVALWRFPPLRRRGAVLGLCTVLIAVSLGLSIEGVARQGASAFYHLHCRMWELLTGGVLALFPVALLAVRRRLREALAIAGLVLIVMPAFIYDAKTPFPGLAAAPPCLGAALIIAANGASLTAVGRLLSLRAVVFVGVVSYSFYLWHWPVLVLAEYRVGAPLPEAARAVLVAMAFVIAVISWRWVETPLRRRRWCASRRSMFILAGSALACVFVASRVIVGTAGFERRFPPLVAHYQSAAEDRGLMVNTSTADIRAGRLIPLGAAGGDATPKFLVWGDSHTLSALPAFETLCRERGIAGVAAARAATPPLLDFVSVEAGHGETVAYNAAVLEYIEKNRIRDVVLVANWGYYPVRGFRDSPPLDAALTETVRRTTAAGARTWILLQVPAPGFEVPRALARAEAFGDPLPPRRKVGRHNGIAGNDPALLDRLRGMGATIIDPRPPFIDDTGERYKIVDDGVVLFYDSNHLTPIAALRMLLPVLREGFGTGR
jgi:peptidoglycan/LPS O-acetylase OafA/YrhL